MRVSMYGIGEYSGNYQHHNRKTPYLAKLRKKTDQYGYSDGFLSDWNYLIKTDKLPTKVKETKETPAKNLINELEKKGKLEKGYIIQEVSFFDCEPVLIQIENKSKCLFFNADYIDSIKTKYPKSEIFLNGVHAVFKQGEEVVGIICKFGDETLKPIANRLIENRYKKIAAEKPIEKTEEREESKAFNPLNVLFGYYDKAA